MKITHIVIHSSDSEHGTVADIRKWHVEDNGWRDVGYHFVITNGNCGNLHLECMDGSIETGRNIDGDEYLDSLEQGAHAYGLNSYSIGICVIGKDTFTRNQIESLYDLINELLTIYDIPAYNVIGHYETPKANGKTCPNIDMVNFRKFVKTGKLNIKI